MLQMVHDKMRSLINQYHELDRIERQDMLMTQLKNLSDARKDNYHTDYDTLETSDSEVDSDTEWKIKTSSFLNLFFTKIYL